MSAWAEQNAAFLGHIPALVFIAVPHRGSAVASKAHHMLLSSAWQEVLRDCNGDHSVMQKLANDSSSTYHHMFSKTSSEVPGTFACGLHWSS